MTRTTTLLLVLIISLPLLANDLIIKLDSLHDKATISNYKTSIELCKKSLSEDPSNFEINWRCARAHRWYGELHKRLNLASWEDTCALYGKRGMDYAQRVKDLAPEKPHGHHWYGVNAGTYADGVSILTALKEGLKGKVQGSFEKVYEIDKTFRDGGSILSLGRLWSSLPWPLKKQDLALKYYREYQNTPYFDTAFVEAPIYLAELLIDIGGKENLAEAKILLESVDTDIDYFSDMVREILSGIE